MNRVCGVVASVVLGAVLTLSGFGPMSAQDEAAGVAQASPTGDQGSAEVLFDGMVSADALPPDPVWVDAYRMEWDPGATWPYTEDYPSFRVWCVETGALYIASAGPVAVSRSGATGAPEATPGAEVTLGPGDCAVTPPRGPYTMRNPGAGLAVVAHGMITPANVDVPAGYPFGQVREEEPFGSAMFSFELPDGPLALRLERLPLPSGAGHADAIDLLPAAAPEVVRVVRIARRSDPAVAYAITVGAAPDPGATPGAGTPAADAAAETLLSVEFPAGVLPPDVTQVELIRYAVAPGKSLGFPEGFVVPRTELAYVLEGIYAVRAAAPLLLSRRGETEPEEVPAQTDVTLGPGDAFVIPIVPVEELGKDALGELRNPGPEPLEALGIAVWVEPPTMAPAGMDLRWYTYLTLAEADRARLASGPVMLVLRRIVLGPSATLPADDPETSRLVVEEATGATRWSDGDGGAIRNDGQEPQVLLVLTLEGG